MTHSKTKTITAFVISGLALMASACNTIEGAGKDIESAGKTIEKEAGDAK